MAKVTNFRGLEVWKLGMEIVKETYKATKNFPKDELYGLISQIRRAAVSIPSNIAEGFNRFHNKEYRQFLFTAFGSCAELETQIELSYELGFLDLKGRDGLLEIINHESRMLRSLLSKINS